MNSPCLRTTTHGQVSTRPVCSAADARFRVVPHMYSTVSVFTTPGAGSPHQPLLTDTRQRGRKPPHAALADFLISGPAVHVRPGTPYSASTISMTAVDSRCRTVQSSSMPATNARATMTTVRRCGLIPVSSSRPTSRVSKRISSTWVGRMKAREYADHVAPRTGSVRMAPNGMGLAWRPGSTARPYVQSHMTRHRRSVRLGSRGLRDRSCSPGCLPVAEVRSIDAA
jgi:hypothetical protein